MKKIAIILLASLFMCFSSPVEGYAQSKKSKSSHSASKPKTVHVKGYTKKNGTYVKPHYRSKPTKRK